MILRDDEINKKNEISEKSYLPPSFFRKSENEKISRIWIWIWIAAPVGSCLGDGVLVTPRSQVGDVIIIEGWISTGGCA